MASTTASSYIDLDKLTASDFSPHTYANSLVLSTNNLSDPSVDLTTPLSRALFDLQEIDSNIHTLTSRSALNILTYTSQQNAAASRILNRVEEERARLNASYARLEVEVIGQYSRAVNAKLNAERSHEVLRLGRQIQRVVSSARQFEALLQDSGLSSSTQSAPAVGKVSNREDHRLALRASYAVLAFKDIVSGNDHATLAKINLVRTIRGRVFEDGEARVLEYARRVVREFTVSSLNASSNASTASFKDAEDTKARFTSAVHMLYLLSPAPKVDGNRMKDTDFEPEYLLRALEGYLQTAIQSSSAGIGRGLGQLPMLERALSEASTRCQNVVALELLLESITPPDHPLLTGHEQAPKHNMSNDMYRSRSIESDESGEENDMEEGLQNGNKKQTTMLKLLLESLDTSSLPSYFWRSLASSLTQRVQEILNRGGVAARTLRSNRDSIRNEIRECVLRGSKMPASVSMMVSNQSAVKEQMVGNWEREAAVMVGSVIGPLNR